MLDFDWAHVISSGTAALIWFYIGRFSQRRDDRQKARKQRDLNMQQAAVGFISGVHSADEIRRNRGA